MPDHDDLIARIVKPLEWFGSEEMGFFQCARTLTRVTRWQDGRWRYQSIAGPYDDPEVAKAAAEADYRARIAAALDLDALAEAQAQLRQMREERDEALAALRSIAAGEAVVLGRGGMCYHRRPVDEVCEQCVIAVALAALPVPGATDA
jgi:hypothetical protein